MTMHDYACSFFPDSLDQEAAADEEVIRALAARRFHDVSRDIRSDTTDIH